MTLHGSLNKHDTEETLDDCECDLKSTHFHLVDAGGNPQLASHVSQHYEILRNMRLRNLTENRHLKINYLQAIAHHPLTRWTSTKKKDFTPAPSYPWKRPVEGWYVASSGKSQHVSAKH